MAATTWIPGAKADRAVCSQSQAAFCFVLVCFVFFAKRRNVDGDDRFALKGSSFSDSDLNSADELLSEHRGASGRKQRTIVLSKTRACR